MEQLAELDSAAPLPTGEGQAPVVMNSSPEWESILWWEQQPGYARAAAYGRATASLSMGCSGALIDDDLIVTAAHCGGGTVTALFGEYDLLNIGDAGLAEARLRARRLGIPSGVPSESALTQFTCTFLQVEGTRDVAYWRCNPNTVSWTETRVPAGTAPYATSAQLLPGQIWGHYNVLSAHRAEGASLYLTSFNRTCALPDMQVLVSPGTIDDTIDDCSGGFTDCFDHDADLIAGSSGGPIADTATGMLFGVQNGHFWWAWGEEDDPCDRWNAAINTGSYIGPMAASLTSQEAGGGGTPIGSGATVTSQVGTQGGIEHNFQCPPGMLVGGVVGTTTPAPQNFVGNMGFVCVPKRGDARFRFDRATVNSGGSFDTNFHVAVNQDLNTFLHEVRSTSPATVGEPVLAMCPPGQFVTSVEANGGQFANRIDRILCATPNQARKSRINVFGETGHIGYWATGANQAAACPAGRFVAGGWIDSDWWTDGFQLRCHLPN